jgi:hypothetical protein
MSDDVEWHEAEGIPYGRIHRRGAAIAENVLGPIIEDVIDFALTPEQPIA